MLWKTTARLLKCRITSAIMFYDMLHGFWVGRGTGTADLEAKLLQQLTSMREADLFEALLDLHKAYGDLYLDRCLGIIMAYRVIPRTIQILWKYQGRLTMVTKARGYFGIPFKVYHSVIQGDPLPPTIFNVVVDAVIRYWVAVVAPTEDGTEGLGLSI